MVKEILIGAGGVIVVAAIIAAVRYQMLHKDDGSIENIFVDQLNLGEIKNWFVDKITIDSYKGVVFYPTRENAERWKIKIPEQENMLIQLVYDQDKDKVVAYRNIAFSEMSPKLKELLDANNGTIVIDK